MKTRASATILRVLGPSVVLWVEQEPALRLSACWNLLLPRDIWAMCGWGHGVIAGKCLQQCCCCPIFIMSTKALVSSLWFPPHHFRNLLISVLLNRYHFPLHGCVALQSPWFSWLWRAFFKGKYLCLHSWQCKTLQWNCCSDPRGTVSVRPFWLHVQLCRMPWKVGCFAGVCCWCVILQFVTILGCHPAISQPLKCIHLGMRWWSNCLKIPYVPVVKCWFLTLITDFLNHLTISQQVLGTKVNQVYLIWFQK